MHPLFSSSVSVKFCTISVPTLNPWLDFFFFFYFAPPTSFPLFPALLLFLLWWGFPSLPRNKRPVCRCSCWEPAEAQFTFFASSLWFHAAPLWTDALGSVTAINTNHTAIFRLLFSAETMSHYCCHEWQWHRTAFVSVAHQVTQLYGWVVWQCYYMLTGASRSLQIKQRTRVAASGAGSHQIR